MYLHDEKKNCCEIENFGRNSSLLAVCGTSIARSTGLVWSPTGSTVRV